MHLLYNCIIIWQVLLLRLPIIRLNFVPLIAHLFYILFWSLINYLFPRFILFAMLLRVIRLLAFSYRVRLLHILRRNWLWSIHIFIVLLQLLVDQLLAHVNWMHFFALNACLRPFLGRKRRIFDHFLFLFLEGSSLKSFWLFLWQFFI